MRVAEIVTLCCLLPSAYQLLAGSGKSRVVAGAALGVFLVSVLARRWASANPESWLAQHLFQERGLSAHRIVLLAASLAGIYLAVITLAIGFNLLDNPYVMTIAFFAMFGGLMALGAVIVAGIQRLGGRRRAG